MQRKSYVLIVQDQNAKLQNAVVPKLAKFFNEKDHTCICKKGSNMLLTTNTIHVTYPLVVIEVEGVKCRALIDTGAGSSHVLSKLISRLNKKPIREESKRTETLIHSVVQKTAIYELQIRDTIMNSR